MPLVRLVRQLRACGRRAAGNGIACFDHLASNRRQDLVSALPISFAQSRDLTGSEKVGMTIAVAIAFTVVMLSGLTVLFTKLRDELKRDFPREES